MIDVSLFPLPLDGIYVPVHHDAMEAIFIQPNTFR